MSPRIRDVLLTTTALLALGPLPGLAGPDGPTVVGGSATITGAGTGTVNINQLSGRAIVNWSTFNIGNGETTTFVQPNSSAVILNRVTGGLGPSEIYGTINANGRVFLINRDGVLFGPNANINTAGFLATTNDIKNRDFMHGRYNFNRPGAPDASIVNLGHITATQGGFAALVAPGVRNSGTITATLGTVALASGNMFTLDMYGDKLIQLGVNDSIAGAVKDVHTGRTLKSLVTNEGKIKANGGRIELTGAAARTIVNSVINNKGILEANTIGRRNGMIVLGAATGPTKPAGAPKQIVKVSGVIKAAGKKGGTKGGTVVVTGEHIKVTHARVNASGKAGGGKVLIGGDWAGGKPKQGAVQNPSAKLETYTIPTATTVRVDAGTTINASATATGNGGKVVLWSESMTTFAGVIKARGGPQGGDGGFVEVSSHGQLNYAGVVDTRAPLGQTGTLLLDPADYYVVTTLGGSPPDASEITVAALQNQLLTSDVVIATDNGVNPNGQHGDIFVNAAVHWGNSNSLTLNAYRNIQVNANLTSTSGPIVLRADSTGTGTGTVNFAHGATVSTAGPVSILYNPTGNDNTTINASSYTNPTEYSAYVTGGGTLTASMLVNTVYDLQNVNNNLSGNFALGRYIDATSTASWSPSGFAPIASLAVPFTGQFNGQGYTIDGLTINSHSPSSPVGLFSSISAHGSTSNLNLTNVAITGTGVATIGALAGINNGSIVNSSATGSITVTSSPSANATQVGGLVGRNADTGNIAQSTAAITVWAENPNGSAGGLVGMNEGTIRQSFAVGDVTGRGSVGGLVGSNVAIINGGTATVEESFAAGSVTVAGGGPASAGGLIGTNFAMNGGIARVAQSYATGSVHGSSNVGGLVAQNLTSNGGIATITQSFATGLVTASAGAPAVGGLVGTNSGTISDSYWDTQTSGQTINGGSGASGLITAKLQESLPAGWDAKIWGLIPNSSYPYLLWRFPNGAQVVAGHVYSDRNSTLVDAGVPVFGLLDGRSLASLTPGGPVTTGANGYYNFLLPPGTISKSGSQVLTYTTGPNGGAAFQHNATTSVFNLDIYGTYLRGITGAGTISALNTGLATAIGNNPTVTAMINALPNRQIDATGPSFAINTGINTGTFVMSSTGVVTQSSPIIANNVALLGAGASYTLNNSANHIGTLVANTGSVNVFSAGSLSVGTVPDVPGVTGVQAATVILGSNGAVTQTAPIVAQNLALTGDGGQFTFTHGGNSVTTLAGATGSNGAVTYAQTGSFAIGTVGGITGVNTGSLALTSAGTVTQSAPITATSLALLGGNGAYVLTNSNNQIGTLAANTGSVNLANSVNLNIGTAGGASGVNVGTLVLSETGAVTQSAPIITTNLALLGVGASFTLTDSHNQLGTLAVNTGSVNIVDSTNLNIGTVAGISGATAAGELTLGVNGNITATGPVNVGLFALAGGNWVQNSDTLPAFQATDFVIAGGNFLRVTGGDGTTGNPYKLADVYGLQGALAMSSGNSYVLANDIDAAGTAAWTTNGGFRSRGTYTGVFDGGSHTISGLTERSGQGLFGTIGPGATVKNLNLANVRITTDLSEAGAVAARNQGTISNVSVSGNVSGTSHAGIIAGGLVATNVGTITQSISSVNVSVADATMPTAINAAGGLVGSNLGTISQSSASGAVSGGPNSFLGGLVGQNGLFGSAGTITSSSASGAVTASGTFSVAGGLAGINSDGSTITNSQAFGNVTSTVSGSAANADILVGGLVGENHGTINGTATPNGAATCATGASFSCATGTVNVVVGGNAGGLVGLNHGTVTNSFATGPVSGRDSILGGLVGTNFGTVTSSFAGGSVTGGGASVSGGFAGSNNGTIASSSASGQVNGGDGSSVGGFVGVNLGAITSSAATGSVTGGVDSHLGGFVGLNLGDQTGSGLSDGTITGSHASGNVAGGAGTLAGGFFGVNIFGAINQSFATGSVSGGDGSTVGGFGGLNIGTVHVAFASGAVTGGNNSFVGGFVGVNFAAVDPGVTITTGAITQAYSLGATTGGPNSLVAGFAGVNVGSLDQTYASGLVTAGPGSTTGGLVASNTFNYTLPPDIALLDPPGTATNSYWDRQTTGQTTSAGGIGVDTGALSTALPTGFDPGAWGLNVGQYPFLAAFGGIVNTAPSTPVLPPTDVTIPPVIPPVNVPPVIPPVIPNPPLTPVSPVDPTAPVLPITPTTPAVTNPPPSSQLAIQQLMQPPTIGTITNTPAQVVNTQSFLQAQLQLPGQPSPSGQPQSPGSQPTGQPPVPTPPTGFGAPPIRLNVGPGRYFYLPPTGETRIVANEAVLQLPCNVAQDALAAATRAVQFTVLSSQCLGSSNIAVYRVQLGNGQTLATTLRGLAAHRIVVAAQANYTYETTQDQPTAGSPDQYVIEKLHLSEAHRLVKGTDIPVAVIDSEVDSAHPDLTRAITDRYDATETEARPHPHGTGMAGAIGSQQKLLGIAPGARLLAIRAFSPKAASAESTTFNILKGLDHAVGHNVRIVNMSFAGPQDPSLDRALKSASDKGMILIAAAGNAGPRSPPLYPAAFPYVIAVTATDMDDKLYSGANRGRHIAIAAPGVDILVPAPEGTYQLTTGTSVATAHISGVVALLLERNPRLKSADVRRILTRSAKRLGPNTDFGAGLVDPVKALDLAAPGSAELPQQTTPRAASLQPTR